MTKKQLLRHLEKFKSNEEIYIVIDSDDEPVYAIPQCVCATNKFMPDLEPDGILIGCAPFG